MTKKYSPGIPNKDLDLVKDYENPNTKTEKALQIRKNLKSAAAYYENKKDTTSNNKARIAYTRVLNEISEALAKERGRHGGIEDRVAASIFVVSIVVLIIGFILSSFNITGFAINDSYAVSNWTGGFLFILGILGLVFSIRRKS